MKVSTRSIQTAARPRRMEERGRAWRAPDRLRPPSSLEAESTPISFVASGPSNQGQSGYGPCVDRQSAELVAKAKLAMGGAPKRVSIALMLGRGRWPCRLSTGAGSAASASLPRLIDQPQTELDLAGPGTPTTLSVLPEAEIRAAPPGAAFVILTHDHALDFLLAVEALRRPDAVYVGMIGSRTKRATFTR